MPLGSFDAFTDLMPDCVVISSGMPSLPPATPTLNVFSASPGQAMEIFSFSNDATSARFSAGIWNESFAFRDSAAFGQGSPLRVQPLNAVPFGAFTLSVTFLPARYAFAPEILHPSASPAGVTETVGTAPTIIRVVCAAAPFFVNVTTAPSAAVGFFATPKISPVFLLNFNPLGSPFAV